MADGWVDFWLDDTDSPVIDCEAFISKLVAEKRLDGFDLAPEENEFVRLGKAEEMRQAISSAVKAGRLKLRDRGGHVSHSGLPRRDDYGPWTGVFFERVEFLAFARDEWSIRQCPPESAADIHESRYQAIGDDARFALFNVAELTAWASANKVAIPFLKLLVTDEHTDIPSERRFQPCGTLPLLIATAYVPVDMDPHEAKGELLASGDATDDGDPVGRLRGRIAASYERHLLNAVYDGKLTVYGRTDYAPIDLTAARLRWKEKSTARTRQQTNGNAIATPPGGPAEPGATDAAWKTRARELAQEFGEAKWARGEREITARNICRAVAKELGKKPEFHGNRGPRSESNVRNEALKGWKFSPPPDKT